MRSFFKIIVIILGLLLSVIVFSMFTFASLFGLENDLPSRGPDIDGSVFFYNPSRSKVFYQNDGNWGSSHIQLEGLDLPSFAVVSDPNFSRSTYVKDKNNVYAVSALFSTKFNGVIPDASPKLFTVLENRSTNRLNNMPESANYAVSISKTTGEKIIINLNDFSYKQLPVKVEEVDSFQVIGMVAKDNSAVYLGSKIISQNPAQFRALERELFYRDEEFIYVFDYCCGRFQKFDVDTFEIFPKDPNVQLYYIKDKNHVLFNGNVPLDQVDPNTFEFICRGPNIENNVNQPRYYVYGKDEKFIYRGSEVFEEAKPSTFQMNDYCDSEI